MFERTEEVKVMRDPIHGYIHVHYKVIWDCINAREFQRLRRIHQLGGDFQVYHTAEHTRFSHSLGVYEIVRRMVEEIEELSRSLSEYEKCAAMLAGLLHDLGHGPFSHAFEAVSDCHHEQFTQRILLEDSEIHRILSAADVRLPQDVADIIGYRYKNDLLNQLVSGQLDADRMDYLLRDAYFTGTSYGTFDMERILRTIRIQDAHLAVKESGIHSVEDYIMARYHMYWQVYLHPVARSYEIMIALLFERMKTLWKQKPSFFAGLEMFTPFLIGERVAIEALFLLDEAAALYGFALLTQRSDPILRDLAARVLDRRLFAYTQEEADTYAKICPIAKANGYDPQYYVHRDHVTQKPYSPYKGRQGTHVIWIVDEQGTLSELSEKSAIVSALVDAKVKEQHLVYYPAELEPFLTPGADAHTRQ
ncbi:HD domain-containing protein [Amedibacillus dolichus]|uniref:HD domain-containing protein n=1 Tax=Amedibacillus dolichus TaxID=31971 RepID=A0ABT7UBG9_9FIRM|nr:HD domain-containing protein [Amedibacillus dolichus]MDM8156978.1 HD domain-containing protein [Amedibacillus dolichus]